MLETLRAAKLKRLHAMTEERINIRSLVQVDLVQKIPYQANQVILLLHGLNERGRRIYRKLLPYLPEDALIIAPNAPFPISRVTDAKIDYGYSWYFFDKFQKNYFINQDMARSCLREILKEKNPGHLPLTIIGFSQGGYLAPLVGLDHAETKLVIGLGCEFRESLVPNAPLFPLIGLHGENDEVVSITDSKHDAEKIGAKWESIPDTAHEISPLMGQRIKELMEAYGEGSL